MIRVWTRANALWSYRFNFKIAKAEISSRACWDICVCLYQNPVFPNCQSFLKLNFSLSNRCTIKITSYNKIFCKISLLTKIIFIKLSQRLALEMSSWQLKITKFEFYLDVNLLSQLKIVNFSYFLAKNIFQN